ncbi:alpha/beta fold hydrolase [Blochmannia endosymbiont of Polyrhachis (Hedomyrma) turneri]|uniref:alpha/beta fold hydrolase n=1 Tax=Blochmannia endosymbiont of Polyrhachis (Hedomyrma) turneri TaxID=1505596 RepID=UPI0006987034|nr:alpha/beta fold hydrolase [Blochmannia endosymbiont of Polyrhachis (Hedomyrma) turneri]
MKKLNYRLNTDFKDSQPSIIFIHGLFGNLNNFNTLAKEFNIKKYNTLQVDLRNHGQSPHSFIMNYKIMAQDILCLLDDLNIKKCIVIGHSMGGKVAMTLPMLLKNHVIKIIIMDIAPTTYATNQNNNIFLAINSVTKSHITSKNEAFILMNKFIHDQKTIFFC